METKAQSQAVLGSIMIL